MDFAGFKVYVYVCLTNSLIENWLYLHVHIQLLLLIWLSISLLKTIIPYVCLVSIILLGGGVFLVEGTLWRTFIVYHNFHVRLRYLRETKKSVLSLCTVATCLYLLGFFPENSRASEVLNPGHKAHTSTTKFVIRFLGNTFQMICYDYHSVSGDIQSTDHK